MSRAGQDRKEQDRNGNKPEMLHLDQTFFFDANALSMSIR